MPTVLELEDKDVLDKFASDVAEAADCHEERDRAGNSGIQLDEDSLADYVSAVSVDDDKIAQFAKLLGED